MASSRDCDSDNDLMQPYYFLDSEEELLSGPGEDIWKKFGPLSPSCPPLETAWHSIDQDCPSSVLLQPFILHDCMWSSSFAAAAKLKNAVSQMLVSLQACCDSASSTTDISGDCQSYPTVPQGKTSHNLDFLTTTMVCINPSEVLPYSTLCKRNRDVSDGAELGVNVGPSEEGKPVEDDKVDRGPLSDVNIQQHSYATQQPRDDHQQTPGKQISNADTHSGPSHSALALYCSQQGQTEESICERAPTQAVVEERLSGPEGSHSRPSPQPQKFQNSYLGKSQRPDYHSLSGRKKAGGQEGGAYG